MTKISFCGQVRTKGVRIIGYKQIRYISLLIILYLVSKIRYQATSDRLRRFAVKTVTSDAAHRQARPLATDGA
jgi:hypothetical protein